MHLEAVLLDLSEDLVHQLVDIGVVHHVQVADLVFEFFRVVVFIRLFLLLQACASEQHIVFPLFYSLQLFLRVR